MSLFKCKMCGGDLEITEGINTFEVGKKLLQRFDFLMNIKVGN